MKVYDLLCYFGFENESEIFIFDLKIKDLVYEGTVSNLLTTDESSLRLIRNLKVDSLDIKINDYFTIFV